MTWQFYIREALSDVSGDKVLGEFAGSNPIELDYQLAANAPLSQVDTFLTAAPEPNNTAWPIGSYVLTLVVQNGESVNFTMELWHADLDGNDIAQIGSTPAAQSGPSQGPETYSFTVTDSVGQTALATDRLKLKLFAENTDASNPHEFSVMASLSSLTTPILREMQVANNFNPYRRGRFLGNFFRPGECSGFWDKNGVDLT